MCACAPPPQQERAQSSQAQAAGTNIHERSGSFSSTRTQSPRRCISPQARHQPPLQLFTPQAQPPPAGRPQTPQIFASQQQMPPQTLSWLPPSEPSWVLQMEVAQSLVDQPGSLCASRSRSWAPPLSAREHPLGTPSIGARTVEAIQAGEGVFDEDGDTECRLKFVSGTASKQHPAKRRTGIVNADAVVGAEFYLGICDGVSGVHHLGIPVDALPKELLGHCRATLEADEAEDSGHRRCSGSSRRGGAEQGERGDDAEDGDGSQDEGTWLVNVIQRAYDATEAFGATTLLLAVLCGSDLVTACLGDCALLVLRPCAANNPLKLQGIFKTEPGRYDSRRPVQVQRLQGFSDAHAHTVIQAACVSTTPILPGDFLVLGSDGIFDNLPDEDIIRTVEQCCTGLPSGWAWQQLASEDGAARAAPTREQLQRAAAALVDLAISRVRLENLDSTNRAPWSAQGDVPANNADDTTALVAFVAEERPRCTHSGVLQTPDTTQLAEAPPQRAPVDFGAVLRDRTNMAGDVAVEAGRGKPPQPYERRGAPPLFPAPPPTAASHRSSSTRGRAAASSCPQVRAMSADALAAYANGGGAAPAKGLSHAAGREGRRLHHNPCMSQRDLRREDCVIS